MLGSHLDSVPNGGWLDGCLGVHDRARSPARASRTTTTAVRPSPFAWSIGPMKKARASAAACSAPPPSPAPHSIEADRGRTDRDGIRLEDALRRCGVDIDRFPEAHARTEERRRLSRAAHRAGPGARTLGLPLGAVLGTKGVERHAITFHGQEAHSGSTPMNARRDALAAAAKLALEIRPIAGKHPDAVCTMGSVKTFPGIVTAVVGRCEATLDQRDLDADDPRRDVCAKLARPANASRAKRSCTVEWSRIWSIEPVPFHPALIDFCEEAIRETAGAVASPALRPAARRGRGCRAPAFPP